MKKCLLFLLLLLSSHLNAAQIPAGSVLISSSNGVIAAPSTTNIVYDRVNNYIGIGIPTPSSPLQVKNQFLLGDNSINTVFQAPNSGNNGAVTIQNSGSQSGYIIIEDSFGSTLTSRIEIGRATNNINFGNSDSDTVTSSISIGLPNTIPAYSSISRAPGTNGSVFISNSGTGAVYVSGQTSTTLVPAGYIGELVTSNRTQANKLTLASGTIVDICSVNVTAGKWRIIANTVFSGNPNTKTGCQNWISATSGNSIVGQDISNYVSSPTLSNATIDTVQSTPSTYVVSVTSTTKFYSKAVANFAVGLGTGETAYGYISAERVH